VNRIRTLRTGTSRTAALAVELRRAAGGNSRKQVNHLRIQPDGTVLAWDFRPAALFLTDTQQQAITELMHATRRDIDWTVAHDYHLTTGMLRRSPAAGERGHDPAADRTFGGTDPVFLPRPTDTTRRAAA
jgi:hypothetical protein